MTAIAGARPSVGLARFLVAVACCFTPLAAQADLLFSNIVSNSIASDSLCSTSCVNQRGAAGFTVPAGAPRVLSRVVVEIQASASTYAPSIELWSSNAGSPNALIQVIDTVSVANFNGPVSLDTNIVLQPSTSYFIVINGVPTSNVGGWKRNSGVFTPSGPFVETNYYLAPVPGAFSEAPAQLRYSLFSPDALAPAPVPATPLWTLALAAAALAASGFATLRRRRRW